MSKSLISKIGKKICVLKTKPPLRTKAVYYNGVNYLPVCKPTDGKAIYGEAPTRVGTYYFIPIYFISEPGFTFTSGATNRNVPSASSANRIIPCDSIPRNFLGARFTKTETCFPTKSSGL